MNVAFIPVRGGSKSIPQKNIKLICGKPLVYWTVKAACQCKYISEVYVATDNDKISSVVKSFGNNIEFDVFAKVHVIGRSAETATDTASTESALLEFAKQYDFDNIALIQATSPLLSPKDLDGGFEMLQIEETDSVISVVRQYRFLWDIDEKGSAYSANYDVFHRPRRQDFDGFLMENGAFYITSRDNLLKSGNRVSGNIKAYEMSAESAVELDKPSDWIIVEKLMEEKGLGTEQMIFPEIKMFLTDCDGCLTDGGMYYSENGDELKKFNTRDGMGLALLRERGIITGIITSESVALNRRRADKLKLDILEEGCIDKASAVKRICKEYQIDLENIAYIGDDVNDLEAIKMVGLGCCPADAVESVKSVASFVTQARGGKGVIREVADKILEKQ